jgi:hypothetical protein
MYTTESSNPYSYWCNPNPGTGFWDKLI